MSDTAIPETTRSYGCSFGCGNPYDYVLVDVADGTAMLLCIPCFIRQATQMVQTFLEGPSAEAAAEAAALQAAGQAPHHHQAPKRRGHNAPGDVDIPGIVEAFDSRITVDDLPVEFK